LALRFGKLVVFSKAKVRLVKNCGVCKIKLVKGVVLVFRRRVLFLQFLPTKRAPDAGDSGENLKQFPTPYHFSSWTASPSTAPAQVTQTVRPLREKQRTFPSKNHAY